MAYIYKNPHEQSLKAAQDELAILEEESQELAQRVAWIEQRKNQLKAHIQAIAALIENDPGSGLAEAGLTQVCRDLLSRNPRWMTAGEIRALLLEMGIDLSPYTNPMAVLHSVLRRVAHTHRGTDGTLFYGPYGVVLHPRSEDAIPELIAPDSIAARMGKKIVEATKVKK